MQITPNQNFKHGDKTYKRDNQYDVSDDDAAYFQAVGWIGGGQSTEAVTSLEVQNIQLGHLSEVN